MRVHPHSLCRIVILSLATLVLATTAMSTQAQTRIIYKSALAGTAYHQMGAELAQAIRQDSSGTVLLSNEESQGSVQNVMEVAAREGLYMFTSPPALVAQALSGEEPFSGGDHRHFHTIRGLFPVPSLTMHFVMAGDDGTTTIDALEEKHYAMVKLTPM